MNLHNSHHMSIRRAGPHDTPALCRLAALDSALPLTGEILLADGASIADPFRPTAGLVAMLSLRREQLAA